MYSLLNESQSDSKDNPDLECPLSLLLRALPTEPLAFTIEPAERFGQSWLTIKNIKSTALFFPDSIQLYLYKTQVSIQCLKKVLQSCSTLYAFLLNMTKLQAMPWGTRPIRPINFLYPGGFVYLSVQFLLTHRTKLLISNQQLLSYTQHWDLERQYSLSPLAHSKTTW